MSNKDEQGGNDDFIMYISKVCMLALQLSVGTSVLEGEKIDSLTLECL